MSVIEASIYVGVVVGTMSSSYVYEKTSAPIMFTISTIMTYLGILYIQNFVPESVHYPKPISKVVS